MASTGPAASAAESDGGGLERIAPRGESAAAACIFPGEDVVAGRAREIAAFSSTDRAPCRWRVPENEASSVASKWRPRRRRLIASVLKYGQCARHH